MRVMILASGDLWAGAEVMVYQLTRGLAALPDMELCVVLLNQNRLAEEINKKGITTYVVEESNHSFPSIFRATRQIAAAFAPDVIHSHRYKENLLAWLTAKSLRKAQVIATQHGMPELSEKERGTKAKLRTWLSFRLLSSCFDHTVLVSQEMKHALTGSYGFSDNNLSVIHNGIGIPEQIAPSASRRKIIGSAGRLFPVKDFSLMVDIARQVTARYDMVDFVLAGDGPELPLLEEKVQLAGLQNRFIFKGHVDDMASFYKSLDIYINTSVHEGIPMSVLEAMSYGLPAVVPNVGGFPEIIEDGQQGSLVRGRDPSMFADRCVALLADPQKLEKMAAIARQHVIDNFSKEAMAANYYQLYRQLLAD